MPLITIIIFILTFTGTTNGTTSVLSTWRHRMLINKKKTKRSVAVRTGPPRTQFSYGDGPVLTVQQWVHKAPPASNCTLNSCSTSQIGLVNNPPFSSTSSSFNQYCSSPEMSCYPLESPSNVYYRNHEKYRQSEEADIAAVNFPSYVVNSAAISKPTGLTGVCRTKPDVVPERQGHPPVAKRRERRTRPRSPPTQQQQQQLPYLPRPQLVQSSKSASHCREDDEGYHTGNGGQMTSFERLIMSQLSLHTGEEVFL